DRPGRERERDEGRRHTRPSIAPPAVVAGALMSNDVRGEIRKVAVLGAGTMGNGIAQVCATAGMEVAMRDVEPSFLERGLAQIDKSLAKLVEKNVLSAGDRDAARARIHTTTELEAAVADADLVVEAIPE